MLQRSIQALRVTDCASLRPLRPLARPLSQAAPLSRPTNARPVKIVEVGPRDGLQNEKTPLSTELKVELIDRLARVGLNDIEAGSFVSPKWVPQMATTAEVLTSPTLARLRAEKPSLSLPCLVPNDRGMHALSTLLDNHQEPLTNEVALFVAASEGFSRANLNKSVAEALAVQPPIFGAAKKRGLNVRAYVSVVLGCPFEGYVDPKKAARVAKELLDMGAYQVSLGDTIGVGVPRGWEELLNECERAGGLRLRYAQAHCHDTYGTAVANVLHCVSLGVPTVDSSVAALGGCPYSPGATGNVSTEDVVYALHESNIPSSARFEELCEVGEWVSEAIGRANGSRVGKAVRGRKQREAQKKAKL
ncbi:aldolase [Rhodotorula sp. JG-1b]|nr:aldolase [Rhodotorula sp. JG-1b]